jgi:hypothetical protein
MMSHYSYRTAASVLHWGALIAPGVYRSCAYKTFLNKVQPFHHHFLLRRWGSNMGDKTSATK